MNVNDEFYKKGYEVGRKDCLIEVRDYCNNRLKELQK